MALLWIDGFDTYGDAGNTAPQPTNRVAATYIYVPNESQIDNELAAGPWGDNCLELGASAYLQAMTTPDLTTNNTMIAGLACRRNTDDGWAADGDWAIIEFKDGTQCGVALCASNDSYFVRNGDGDFVAGSRVKTDRLEWHYLEIKAVASTTNAGSVEVRINNCPVISVSGIKTAFGSNNYYTRCTIGDVGQAIQTQAFLRVDDFYLCDGSGGNNDDFLGTVHVDTIFPDGDDSVNFATTGNSSNHYENVGISDAMWTTDYVQDSTTGNRDIFTMEATQNFNTIYGIMANVLAVGITSNQNYHIVVDSNGTETESANIAAVTSTNNTGVFVVELNPDTSSAWTPATVNAVKCGIELQ